MRSLPPAEAALAARHDTLAGNKGQALADLLADGRLTLDLLPDANYAHLLPETRLTRDLSPIYGRGPDAKIPQPREPRK